MAVMERGRRLALALLFIVPGGLLLTACGSSSAPQIAAAADLGECTTDVATDRTIVPALLPNVEQVRQRQVAVDQFGGGFRINGNAAEIGYIHYLTAQLRALGATDVTEEPYTFSAWSPKTTKLEVVQGPAPGPVKVAYFIPSSGSTGPAGITGELLYLSALSEVNLVSAVYNALNQQSPGSALLAIQAALQNAVGGGVSLAQTIASANVAGKIVIYDAPRLSLPIGVFEALSVYVNDASGTMGPTTPYSRPFVEELLTIGVIDEALKAAGAAGVIAVLDYPPGAADNSYVPFGGLAIPSVPGIYLDRYAGNALKQQIVDSGATPVTVKLTLDATQSQATSYNVSALIPGACPTQILVSSHSDGPNSVEDNGPAAILLIADYFVHAPVSQRRRGLKIVFTGGHMVGSPGINAYIAKHQADLTAHALTAIEIEHLGAREWVELSPGTMALDGLPEPLVLYAGIGSVQQDENIIFAKNFDRSLVTIPLPFGEGPAWASTAGLPKIQVITGPVYLLNGPMPEVSSEFTDYDLEQRQITAFIQMILNLNTRTAATLRADQNFPNVSLP
ncbi:MAG: hypothetical protein ACRETM_02530 [Stenotrophobium sp.]